MLRALLCALALALCMLPALPPAAPTAAEGGDSRVRVLLSRLQIEDEMHIRFDGVYAAGEGDLLTFPRGAEVSVTLRDGQLILHYEGMTVNLGAQAAFTRHAAPEGEENGMRLQGGSNLYEGDLLLTASQGVIRPVLTIDVEDYLLGVVPYEMSDSFPIEALKAQAVAARTYVLRKIGSSGDYDVVDTTNDQVFRGMNPDYPNAIAAVEQTAGVCGYYNGRLAECYYSASNGGQTELVENVWSGGGDYGYIAMVDDPYDLENPQSVVRAYSIPKSPGEEGVGEALHALIVLSLSEQLEALSMDTAPENVRVDEVTGVQLHTPLFEEPSRVMSRMSLTLRVSGRRVLGEPQATATAAASSEADDLFAASAASATPSPTPSPAPTPALEDFASLGGTVTIDLPAFPDAERAMNLSINRDANEIWTVRETDDAFVVEARRYGHGVGLSQRGAEWMAQQYGMTYEQILAFYYPGMELAVYASTPEALPTLDAELYATPGPQASPTPRPTLMPVTQELPEGAWYAVVGNIEDDSSLNLRKEPSLDSDVRMRLLKGQRLIVLGQVEGADGWVEVRTDVTEGYVMEEFLIREEEGGA